MFGMDSCWFCREPVEEAAATGEFPVASGTRVATSTAPPRVVRDVRTVAAPPADAGTRVRADRVIVRGIFFGLLLTIGLLVFEGTSTRFAAEAPSRLALERHDFERFGFSISAPRSWTPSETGFRAELRAPERIGGRPSRGVHAILPASSFEDVSAQIDRGRNARPDHYRGISTDSDSVDGAAAVVTVFVSDDLRKEQWWIERGDRMLRIEFWSRAADDDAPELNERMIRSVRLS
jgi:hypothetical protein